MPLNLIENGCIARLELPGQPATSADVLLYGATLISWKCDGHEKFFLSKKAALDGSGAVRGGIPLVFPVFGSPSHHADNQGLEKLPKHGVARTATWKVSQQSSADSTATDGKPSAKVTFTLSSADIPGIEAVYAWPFHLAYDVILTTDTLTTAFHITHTSPSPSKTPMRFQALLHNYLAVPSSLDCSVSGLSDQSYLDKTDAGKRKQPHSEAQPQTPIVLQGKASDAVYLGPAPETVRLTYNQAAGSTNGDTSKGLDMTRSRQTLPQTVLWNPAEAGAASIGDLHPGAWKEYVCVEPGYVSGFHTLQPDTTWSAWQTLRVW